MTISTGLKRSLAAAVLIGFGATSVAAHPHVWINNRTDVIFNDQGLITGIAVEWDFDKEYTKIAIEGLDANDDGYYSAGELQLLATENIKALKDYDYFVYMRDDKKKLAYQEVTEYGQVHSNDVLKMYFTVPLAEPIDPKTTKFNYAIYDPSFFIAIDYPDQSAVSAIGKRPANCNVTLHQPQGDENTAETRQMLSEKPPEWEPSTEEDFGSLFAQAVSVTCKPKTASK